MAISRRTNLERAFPRLGRTSYEITSRRSVEPDPALIYHWPEDAPREYTMDAYIQAFASLGYRVCPDAALQEGVEKVAIFARKGVPQHAARQLPDGRWTSKCGQLEDIAHELHALEGDAYGTVVIFLARSLQE